MASKIMIMRKILRMINLALASASSGSGWSPAVAAPVLHNKLLNCSIDTKALLSEPILF